MAQGLWRLDQFSLFAGLNATELQEISSIVNKTQHKTGEIITDQSDKTRNVFVLIDGRVDIVSLTGVPLYRISKGEIFGELGLVPHLKRTALALAREDSWVLTININHLETFGINSPDIYQTVSKNIVNSLGIKLARANKLIELLKTELSKNIRK